MAADCPLLYLHDCHHTIVKSMPLNNFLFNLVHEALGCSSNLIVSPEFSGKVGLSLALAIAIFSLANSFIQVKIPSINSQIASNQIAPARAMFTKSLLIGCLFYLASTVTLVTIFALVKHPAIDKLTSRMLPLTALISLLACYGLQLLVMRISEEVDHVIGRRIVAQNNHESRDIDKRHRVSSPEVLQDAASGKR